MDHRTLIVGVSCLVQAVATGAAWADAENSAKNAAVSAVIGALLDDDAGTGDAIGQNGTGDAGLRLGRTRVADDPGRWVSGGGWFADADAGWTVEAEPMAWFPALNGRINFESGEELDIDVLDLGEVRATPAVQVRFAEGPWRVEADAFFFGFDTSRTSRANIVIGGTPLAPGDEVDFRVRYSSASLTFGRELYAAPIGRRDPRRSGAGDVELTLDGFFGVRGYALELDIDQRGNGELFDDTTVWADPIVGARMRMDLPRGFGLDVRADTGGFGVGSDFVWNVEVGFTAEVAPGVEAEIGFRHLDVRYRDSNADLTWDVALAGLFGGVVIRY